MNYRNNIEAQDNLDKVSAKILVLGDSGVGKSSLIHLICHSSTLNSPQWTIGCAIDIKLQGNYYLEFWDVGGSRSHKIARSFLYTNYHGIILVFDATNNKSRANLGEWLAEVSKGPQKVRDRDFVDSFININVPTITIATKKDLLPYGSVFENDDRDSSSSDLNKHHDSDCSVINFSPETSDIIPQPTRTNTSRNFLQNNTYTPPNPSRKHQTTSSETLQLNRYESNSSLLSGHSSSAINLSQQSRYMSKNEVIFVNTQDALSFNFGSKNYGKLNNFFKHVIDVRNNRF